MRPRLDESSTAVRLGFCCDKELREAIVKIALERNVRLSDVIRDLIRKGLDEHSERIE